VVALTADSTFVYAASYTSPAVVVKIRQDDMVHINSVALAQPWGVSASAITAGWDHLYVGTDTSPGELVKFTGITEATGA
jgi:hypothetical protein